MSFLCSPDTSQALFAHIWRLVLCPHIGASVHFIPTHGACIMPHIGASVHFIPTHGACVMPTSGACVMPTCGACVYFIVTYGGLCYAHIWGLVLCLHMGACVMNTYGDL